MTNAYTRFVITGDARTGSNMVAQALNTNPAIRCFREIFSNRMTYVDYFVEGYDPNDPDDIALRDTEQVRFLETRIFDEHPAPYQAVGFKYLYGHYWGHDPVTDHLRADRELRVIHLKRRNMLRSLVSVRLAEETNNWIEDWGLARQRPLFMRAASAMRHPARTAQRLARAMRPPPPIEKPRPTITADECRTWFARTVHEVSRVDGLFAAQPMLEIFYEDMIAARSETFETIQRFIGASPAPLVVALRKQNPEPLHELIANYDGLRGAFTGSEYEAFFDD